MKRFLILCTAVVIALSAPARAQAPAVLLTAQQIALYSDRALLVADGGVSVRMGATQIDATRAMYDLSANTLTASGDVSVKSASGTATGSGYVYDFKKKQGVFVAGAAVAQLNPDDALALAQQVELQPGVSLTFSNGQVRSGTTFTPAASYEYAIPPPGAKDFGYSPVPSAALEWPVIVSQGRNAYTFARARYDKYNGGPGTGLEEHFASSDRGYAAFAQTLDVDGGRFDMVAYQRLNDSLSQSLTGSTLYGSHALRYALTSSDRYGFASLSFAQYNATRSDDLLLTSNQHPIVHAGSVRVQIDFGHDVHPTDWPVAQDLRATPGLHVDSATVHLGASTISSSVDLGESFYNYGRATLASAATLWGTFPVDPHLLFNGGATFSHDAPPFPSTYRTYTGGMTWRASEWFNLISSLTYAHDDGQEFGVGRPQFSAAFDVRFLRKNRTGLEVGTILPFGGVGDLNRQAVLNVRFIR